MTDVTTARHDGQPVSNDPEALHADIEDARARLGQTVDEIGHRLDVKTRLKSAAHDAGHRVNEVGHRVNEIGRRKPVVIAGGGVAAAAVAGASVLAWRRRGRTVSDDVP